MKKLLSSAIVALSLLAILASPALAEKFSWSELRRADGNVEDFSGQAWFCQAKTSGNPECTFGSKAPQPGCYVLLNKDRTSWVSVDDTADKLGTGRNTPDSPMKGLKGYGCGNGVPRATDYWLVVQ